MISFIKSNLRWLSLLGLAVAIVLLAFLLRPESIEYQLSVEQSLKMVRSAAMEVGINELGDKQLIDIRSSERFAQGHPDKAINIPVRNLLDKASIDLFDQLLGAPREVVFYGSDQLQATAPALLLQQLGYHNVKIFKGGINASNELKETPLASTETSVLDTSAMRINIGQTKPTGIRTEQKEPQTVVPVRKQSSSGGGC